MERPNGHNGVAIARLRRAYRYAVCLKTSKDSGADVFGWALKLCGCGSLDRARQLCGAKHHQSRVVFHWSGHHHALYLTC